MVTMVNMVPLSVTLKKVYDRNVVNKYRLYLLLRVKIFNLIDYISICTDAELFISFCRIIYIYLHTYQPLQHHIMRLISRSLQQKLHETVHIAPLLAILCSELRHHETSLTCELQDRQVVHKLVKTVEHFSSLFTIYGPLPPSIYDKKTLRRTFSK